MHSKERGGLKTAFAGFSATPSPADKEAELKLLGRAVEQPATSPDISPTNPSDSYQVATPQVSGGLQPRPLLQREPVRQVSFRCPLSLASDLRLKAAFNQLEQQEIIIEGIKRVLADLQAPPDGWLP